MADDDAIWSFVLPLLRCLPALSVDLSHLCVTLLPVGHLQVAPSDLLTLWRRRVEALELLALVWLLDPRKWRALLESRESDMIRGDLRPNGNSTMPLHLVMLSTPELTRPDAFRAFLEAVFAPVPDSEHSEGFRDAKAKLLAREHRQSVLVAAANLQIDINLGCQRRTGSQDATILRWHNATRGAPRRCKLNGFRIYNPNTVSLCTMGMLRDQVQDGLAVGFALIGMLGTTDAWKPHSTNQFFTDLMGEYGAKKLRVRHLGFRRWVMEAFFSKLFGEETAVVTTMHKMSVHLLRLDSCRLGDSVTKRRSGMLWWFAGLFGQDARHSIHEIQFASLGQCVPTLGDMRWLAELLRTHGAPRPELFLADAFEDYVTSEGPREDRWLVIPRGYPIQVPFGRGPPHNTLVFNDRVTRFRLLRNDPQLDFVDILVPGYGCCLVKRSETVAIETAPLREWKLDQHSIHTMELGLTDVNEVELSSLRELLGLVGRPVTTLRLTRDTSRAEGTPGFLEAEFLQALVSSCPRLDELVLEAVPFASAHALVDLYEHHGCCIKTLTLLDGVFGDQSSLLSFLEALRTRSRKISRTLESLSLDFTKDGHEDDDTLVLAVFAMLEDNKRLRSVHLRCSRRRVLRYAPRFRSLRETTIHAPKTPLPLRAKHALLSAVSHTLEADVLSTVFEFAPECATRYLTVSTP